MIEAARERQAESAATAIRPEVLAPAGDRECLRAAIENGADAVYFGLTDHNARARATNFAIDELAEVMETLHERGVKGYVTLNTLIFPRELDALEPMLRRVALARADAIIVQDLGLLRLSRMLCPDLPVHASTQMTITSAESLRFVAELGAERVILARELSLAEIKRIRTQTQVPLEVFVHGALCVAYSGQCLTSEALGGRSANRGQCAQACRLPYDLICDGERQELGELKYLLSPQDLAAFDLVPQLVALGVSALKIEGRLKTPEYVANITRHYRAAVDGALHGQPVAFRRPEIDDMQLSFSRGFSKGWLNGNNHKVLVMGLSPRKRGLFVGDVMGVKRGRVQVRLQGPLKRGDGIVFDRGAPEEEEQGGRVYEIFRGRESLTGTVSQGVVELAFGRGDVDLAQVQAGHRVWKTDDPELTRRLRRTFTGDHKGRRTALHIDVVARAGEPMRLECRADSGARAALASSEPLATAERHPLTEALLREQLGRLGHTVYELTSLRAEIAGSPMAPLSVLGALRREMIARLQASLGEAPRPTVSDESALEALRGTIVRSSAAPDRPRLHVLCRTLGQVEAAAEAEVKSLYADLQDIRECGRAVQIARAAGATIFLATPRIQKPAEAPIFKYLAKHSADGMLVRNLGGLAFCRAQEIPHVADFSLNAANELSVQLLEERGAERVTAAHDLNHEQLFDLVAAVAPGRIEIVVHQHMPMFHMEHCVFCAFLSPGTDRSNCGRPCDDHDVKLRDRVGLEHPLKADVGCRNTLFNAVPQSAAEYVPGLLERGVRHFRLELLQESGPETKASIALYRALLAGELGPRDVWTRLKATSTVGVTRGPLGV
jgi:putative protease